MGSKAEYTITIGQRPRPYSVQAQDLYNRIRGLQGSRRRLQDSKSGDDDTISEIKRLKNRFFRAAGGACYFCKTKKTKCDLNDFQPYEEIFKDRVTRNGQCTKGTPANAKPPSQPHQPNAEPCPAGNGLRLLLPACDAASMENQHGSNVIAQDDETHVAFPPIPGPSLKPPASELILGTGNQFPSGILDAQSPDVAAPSVAPENSLYRPGFVDVFDFKSDNVGERLPVRIRLTGKPKSFYCPLAGVGGQYTQVTKLCFKRFVQETELKAHIFEDHLRSTGDITETIYYCMGCMTKNPMPNYRSWCLCVQKQVDDKWEIGLGDIWVNINGTVALKDLRR